MKRKAKGRGRFGFLLTGLALGLLQMPVAAHAAGAASGTPVELVKAYGSLADGILALKRTEEDVCRAILAATSTQAQGELDRAKKAIAAGDAKASQAAVEALAANVGQLATEGDSAVGAVRKKLLDGGHHHNAAGEAQGLFDEGFVIVTRAAKAKLLESSRTIGQMARAPRVDALEAEWKKVEAVLAGLLKPGP
jgi:HAMP domain-containing protein